jgi:hypothetical protein
MILPLGSCGWVGVAEIGRKVRVRPIGGQVYSSDSFGLRTDSGQFMR